ncbi:MAG: dihydrodipicolinate synthase family protein, partial [bacterium]|nr:dihydrodipicolinate synthase family protein [bacterium]
AGILKDTEAEVLSFVRNANTLPCTGVVIPVLYTIANRNTRYLQRVHRISKKPIIVYNRERRSLNSTAAVRAWDALSQIIAVKDSSMNVPFLKKLIALRRRGALRVRIYQGMEHLLLRSAGCDGYIISLLNTEPGLCREMFVKQDRVSNEKIVEQFWRQNLGGNWYVTLKAILCERGIIRSAEEVRPRVQPI